MFVRFGVFTEAPLQTFVGNVVDGFRWPVRLKRLHCARFERAKSMTTARP